MAVDEARQVELASAGALLDLGVSLPLWEVRLPWRKEPWQWRVVMRRPLLCGLVRIAMATPEPPAGGTGVTLEWMARHGAAVARVVAIAITGGRPGSRLKELLLRWALLHLTQDQYLVGAWNTFLSLLDLRDFTRIITSLEALNPMRPAHVSQGMKGS